MEKRWAGGGELSHATPKIREKSLCSHHNNKISRVSLKTKKMFSEKTGKWLKTPPPLI